MNFSKKISVLLVAGLAAALAREPDWYYMDPDSMPRLGTNKLFYLEQKAGLTPRPSDEPESLNVRMVGKWGGGPSWGVTGRDTLVYLSRGSEVVVINFADTADPVVLNHIQARRLAGRPVLADTLLYLTTSGYVEVFNVADPVHANRVGRLATPVADIDVEDTLVYTISADSFKVFSFADPGNPYLVGACRDSGYALDVDRGYAYLRDRRGMWILDATDPANPHRIASWGTDIAGVKVRGNHCYVAQGQMGTNSLYVLNVSNPALRWREGMLSGLTGEDIYLVDTLLFLPGFDVVNVADSSRPALVAQTPVGGYLEGVWVDESVSLGFVAAHYAGLHLLNLADVGNPAVDTTVLAMGNAVDVSVRNGVACVAGAHTGMAILDVSDPARPCLVGRYDTVGTANSEAVLNADSIAYVEAFVVPPREIFHAVDIREPTRPVKAGAGIGFGPAGAFALCDSLLYVAEWNQFEVFSVANPRRPEWLGRCNLQEASSDVVVRGSLAYVACLPSAVIDVADPSQPTVIGTISSSALGIAVYDTFAYLAVNYGGLKIWSIADPRHPYRVDTIPYARGYDVEVSESLMFYGGLDFRVLDLVNPAMPNEVGSYATPYRTRKIAWDGQYAYTACFMAGICVLEYLPTGIGEGRGGPMFSKQVSISPNPTSGYCVVLLGSDKVSITGLYDVAGKAILREELQGLGFSTTSEHVSLNLTSLAPGAYFLRLAIGPQQEVLKILKQ